MKIDRKFFYDTVRATLTNPKAPRLTTTMVKGMNALLVEAEDADIPLPYIAYIFATVHWETGGTFQAVREGFAKTDLGARRAVAKLFKQGKIKRNYALPHKNGNSYYGRGFPQLTHGSNYKYVGEKLALPLYDDPDLMLDLEVSAEVTVYGMAEGWFTGKALEDYIDNVDESDAEDLREYANARRVVNGTDKAIQIAKLAVKYEKALRWA